MKSLPTDHKILKCIKMYAPIYPGKESGDIRGKNDPYLPIKIQDVAGRLGCSPEMLFGRLYYHLEELILVAPPVTLTSIALQQKGGL